MTRPRTRREEALSLAALAALLALAGCFASDFVSNVDISGATGGKITPDQAASIKRGVQAAAKASERITPEQEYYIGRAVAASLLKEHKPYQNDRANRYVNMVGQSLALNSQAPETFGGYHFLILDSEEINAFAAPGGLVLPTRGLLRCCRTEDELAAVLAHEIAHVGCKHGLGAIKTSRVTSMLAVLAAESAKQLGDEKTKELTVTFEDTITDVTSTMVNSGYSRDSEREADDAAVKTLAQTGYNPGSLVNVLAEMKSRFKPNGPGFARTHPDPSERIKLVRKSIGDRKASQASSPAGRLARFQDAMKGV